MIDRTKILAGIKKLPAFSTTVVRLSELVNDAEAGPGEFEAVVQPDMALTANLLRMANSAYFGLSRRIGSAREAITLLGVRRVFELGAMAAVDAVVPETLPGYGIDAGVFWTHSVAVAVIAERLSKERKLATPMLTFTAGLLHDVGKLVISSFLAECIEALHTELASGDMSLIACEQKFLGADHAQIGAELGVVWNLPEEVVKVIASHHAPETVNEGRGDVLVDLIHAADCLSHSMGFGADVGGMHRQVDDAAIARLGLRHIDLEHVASRALPEIEGLSQFGRSPKKGTGA
ncbi:MAG TPA: HDOD domain-containing protein [Polyangia bacterium]